MTKFVLVFLLGFVLQLGNCDVECFKEEYTIIDCIAYFCENGGWVRIDNVIKTCSEELKCTPGQLSRSKCEECRCPLEGNAACRKSKCLEYNQKVESMGNYECLIGDSLTHDGCNSCYCGYGMYECTLMGCMGNVRIPEGECIAGDIKMNGCTEVRCDDSNRWVTNDRNCKNDDN